MSTANSDRSVAAIERLLEPQKQDQAPEKSETRTRVLAADPLIYLIQNNRYPQIADLTKWGLITIFLFFGSLLAWSIFAPLATGAVVMGRISVEGDRTLIEHFEGGIVEALHVSNGQEVSAGTPLVDIKLTEVEARHTDLTTQLFSLQIRQARLRAEWADEESVDFSVVPQLGVSGPARDETIRLEQEQFRERRNLFQQQERAAQKTLAARRQILRQLQGIGGTMEERLKLIDEEIAGVDQLLEQGLAAKTRLLALKRQREGVLGEQITHQSQIVTEQDRIQEAQLRLNELTSEYREDIASQLASLQIDVDARLALIAVTSDQLARAKIVSPEDGIVMNPAVRTVGEVIEPGTRVFDIVPQDAKLVVSARLMAQDGSNIVPGLPAKLTVMAFKGRNSPQLDGIVSNVSPDILTDEMTGEDYYTVTLDFSDQSLADLGANNRLQPGFPVQAVIQTASQPVMVYLISPILTTVRNAFVEP